MTIDPQGFPLDLTGESTRNLVVNDTRTIASSDDSVFVPDGGPFFTRTLVIQSGSRTLIPNVDYKCLHLLKDASSESGLDVSAVVMITDATISTVSLNYQVIGGQYGDTVPVIRQLLENAGNIEKSINWHTHVYAKPDLFEPAPHFVSGEDFSDWSSVLNGIRAIERAILLKDVAAWESAFQYLDNLIKHRVSIIDLSNFYTKSDVNAEIVKLSLKTDVYTKVESNTRHYSKSEVNALIGDIDGNETYYTESEINGKFVETIVADAKYATKAEVNRVDSAKAEKSSVYTRTQVDDRFPLKTTVYNKDYIDTTFVIKGTSYNKAETEARYALKTDAYNKVDSDKRYALKSQIATAPDLSKFISRDDADSIYLKINTADVVYLRKTTADSVYAKHTDLEVIVTLTKKFANYYTRLETDEKFITLTEVNSVFLTKAQGTALYYTKTYSTSTFASKVELTSEVSAINSTLAKKVDLTFLASNNYTAAQTESKFYNKIESDAKYPTKSYLDAAHYNKIESNKILEQYALLNTTMSMFTAVNSALDLRYTKAEINATFYPHQVTDARYVYVTTFDNAVSVLNSNISTRAQFTWVNDTFYTKVDIDRTHYTRFTIDSTFYNRTQSDVRYLTNAAYTSDIKQYAKAADVYTAVASDARYYHWSQTYSKAETYSKSEADARYHLTSNHLLNITSAITAPYNGGLLLSNVHASANIGATIFWDVRSDKVMGVYPLLDTITNDYAFNVTTKNVGTNSLSQVLSVHSSRIWHKTYGWLDTYFAKSANHYSKAETYSKSESDGRYYDKTYTDRTFVNVVEYGTFASRTGIDISNRATLAYVDSNFYSKAATQSLYYNKNETVANFYTKASADATFTSLSKFDLEIRKMVPVTVYNATTTGFNQQLAQIYTKAESDNKFATRADLTPLITLDTATAHFPTKDAVAASYYNKWEGNARYEPIGTAEAVVNTIRPIVTQLQYKIEAYKVGDIYLTTINFSSSASINQHHGYGTWERFAQGYTLMGHTPNGWLDGSNGGLAVMEYNYYVYASIMGHKSGGFKHKLTPMEMPVHNHSTYPYNKFAARSSDTQHNRTPSGFDWNNRHSEYGTGDMSTEDWHTATESTAGGSHAHNNVQPSITVGMWKRIA